MALGKLSKGDMGVIVTSGGDTCSSVNFIIPSTGLELGNDVKGVVVLGTEVGTTVLAGELCSLIAVALGKESNGDLGLVATAEDCTFSSANFIISSSGLKLEKYLEGPGLEDALCSWVVAQVKGGKDVMGMVATLGGGSCVFLNFIFR